MWRDAEMKSVEGSGVVRKVMMKWRGTVKWISAKGYGVEEESSSQDIYSR